MAEINVYMVGDHKFDPVLWVDQALTWGDMGFKGVRDMVSKLVKLCARGDRLAELTIVGHGNENGQFVGQDWLCQEVVAAWRPELVKMITLFGKNRHVIMGGGVGRLATTASCWRCPTSGTLRYPVIPHSKGQCCPATKVDAQRAS